MPTARESLDRIVGAIGSDPAVQGVYLTGSVKDGTDDEVSDLDLWVSAEEWSPDYLAGLLIAGTVTTVGPGPLFHGVDFRGVIVDIRFGPIVPTEYVELHRAMAQEFPQGAIDYDNLHVDFWINSYKSRKPLYRGLDSMVVFGLPFERMALMRAWVEADTGVLPGYEAFSIHGLTPLVRDHLTPHRKELLGLPNRNRNELITTIQAHRDEMAKFSPPDSALMKIVMEDRLFAGLKATA